MTELIIHIGAHKTGTTAIQKFLFENASRLTQYGLTYPKSNWYHYSQHRLAFALKGLADPGRGDRPDAEREIDELNHSIIRSETPRIVISSEELFSCKPDRIALLAEKVKATKVSVIAVVRRPDELLLSSFNQKAKQPGNQFKRSIQFFVNNPRSIDPDISTRACIENWRTAFGRDSTVLRCYEDAPPVELLCSVVGLPQGAFDAPEQVNVSVPGPVIELMRLSKVNGMDPAKQKKLFRQALSVFRGYPKFSLPDGDRKTIIRAFEKDNDALFASFGRDNPYTVSAFVPQKDDALQPNLTFKDMLHLVDSLI